MSKKIIKTIFIIASFLILAPAVSADVSGETKLFFADSSYDFSQREVISATLQKISSQLYFYIDDTFWRNLSSEERSRAMSSLSYLADEFERKIYPTLTSTFGSEWKPGIDGDNRITVLIHPMKKGAGGYFYSGNEYYRLQSPKSNEREMVCLNSDNINSPFLKSLLSHEFLHLITFNQKERMFGKEEEVWLNEARAEAAITLLGYDGEYTGSNLQRRVSEFLNNPSDALLEWYNTGGDYGVANLFIQYLLDHYGVKILADSLHSSRKGIESINYALSQNGFKENFSQIFTDWTITVLVNDCSLGPKYCYKNANLTNLRVVPFSNFLPINSDTTLSVNYFTKNWAGNWQKIFGGGGILTFEFQGELNGSFKVPYLLCDFFQKCQVNFLILNQYQMGSITLEDFNKKYASLIIIPSSQKEFSNGITTILSFAWKVKINSQNSSTCSRFGNNLYYGLRNISEVRCLQEFLKQQGPTIYPEGLVTGNFLSLTKSAAIRFQEKYASEILNPLGLSKGTGYVGSATRAKINQLLGF